MIFLCFLFRCFAIKNIFFKFFVKTGTLFDWLIFWNTILGWYYMSKTKLNKNPKAIEIGSRLRNVIEVYFVTVNRFAAASKTNASHLSSIINGNVLLSDKIANKLQNTVGVNKKYLFDGELPLMLDQSAKPIGDTTFVATTKTVLRKDEEQAKANRGNIPLFVMSRRGWRSVLSSQGEINITDVSINGIKEPFGVMVSDNTFWERYKKFNLLLNCYLFIDNEVNNGDPVLVKVDKEHYICIYDDTVYYEAIDKKPINVNASDVVGSIYGQFSKFEID